MGEMDILPHGQALFLNGRAHKAANRARRYRRLDHQRRAFRADLQHVFHRRCHIGGVDLFARLVIGGGDRDNVHICTDIFF